jgi:hypothetical protein
VASGSISRRNGNSAAVANGELREANLISELGVCLAVAAFAQMAGGIPTRCSPNST